MSATLTCTSDVSANQIEWLDNERRVVARVTSMDRLDLTFNPVNDSIHNSVYTCRVTRGDDIFEDSVTITVAGTVNNINACDEYQSFIHITIIFLPVPPNTIVVTITTSDSATVGQEYTLECNVSTVITGLTNVPTVTWLHPNGSLVTSDGGITISPSTPSSSSTLTFTPLTISHAGQYTCEGSIESPALDSPLTVRETQNVTLQCNIFAYEIYSVHFILKDVDLSSVTVVS